MSIDLNEVLSAAEANIDLSDFVEEFKSVLLDQLNQANPPVYSSNKANPLWQAVMDTLKRKPFEAQADVVQAIATLLVKRGEQAGIINAEMGTGKVRRIGA